MSEMLKAFVKKELDEQIKKRYPHMRCPPCVYAKVVNVKSKENVNICTLRILDKNKQPDTDFSEIPMIRTRLQVEKGNIVVVLLMYGDAMPYIVGRCE